MTRLCAILFGAQRAERAPARTPDERSVKTGLAAKHQDLGEFAGSCDRGVGFVAMDVGNFA